MCENMRGKRLDGWGADRREDEFRRNKEMEGRRCAPIETGQVQLRTGVAQVARAAGLNRLRCSHAGFAWPQRLATWAAANGAAVPVPSGQSASRGRTVGARCADLVVARTSSGEGSPLRAGGRAGACQGPREWPPPGGPGPRCLDLWLPPLQTPKLCQSCWEPGRMHVAELARVPSCSRASVYL